jgi:ribosomal protein S18 acetylase RimI-like enzyme
MSYTIEPITQEHVPAILTLMTEFARYEKLESYLEITEGKLTKAMFGDGSFVEGLIASINGERVGYAIYYPCFSTFRGQCGFVLEDLYVSEKCRGTGLGERMLRTVAGVARSRGFDRIDFQVLDWNQPAIGFYEKLGAVCASDERHFKFTDEAFADLAGEA